MRHSAAKICLAIIMLAWAGVANAHAERFFSDYMGKPILEVFAAEGPPARYVPWDTDEYMYRLPVETGVPADYMLAEYSDLSYGGHEYEALFTVKDNMVTGVRAVDHNLGLSDVPDVNDFSYTWNIGQTCAKILEIQGPPAEFAVGVLPYPHDEDEHEKLSYGVIMDGIFYDVKYTAIDSKIAGVRYFCAWSMNLDVAPDYALNWERKIMDEFQDPVWTRRIMEYSQENPLLHYWDLVLDILDARVAGLVAGNAVDGITPHLKFGVFFWDSTDTAALDTYIRWSLRDSMAETWHNPDWTNGGDPAKYGITPLPFSPDNQ